MPLPARAPAKKLHPEIERLVYQVKVVKEEAEGLVDGLNETQFYWSPRPGEWSIGENLEHLNLADPRLLDAIDAATRRGRADGKVNEGPYAYNFLSRWFLRAMQPPAKRKFKARQMFQPGPRRPMAQVMEQRWNIRDRCLRSLDEASGVDLAAVKVPSPVNRWLKYNLGMAFWILLAHNRRHLWQARNVRNAPRFPAN
jgi:hypothetical protein